MSAPPAPRPPRLGERFLAAAPVAAPVAVLVAALIGILAGCAPRAEKAPDACAPCVIPLPDPASGVAPGPDR